MGVPMSKPEKNNSELSESGQLYESIKDDDDNDGNTQQSTSGEVYKDASSTDIPKPYREGTETLQMLCAVDDDDIEDTEWKDIYQRLKTNKDSDLHIANTKFITGGGTSSNTSSNCTGPIFTSNVTERPTRITSANFNPNVVPMEKDKKLKRRGTVAEKLDLTEDEDIDNSEELIDRPPAPIPPITNKVDTEDDEFIKLEEDILVEKKSKDSSITDVKSPRKSEGGSVNNGPHLLALPPDNRLRHSTTPASCTLDDPDLDFDPFEGMNIPRERVSSFGSASVYSVKVISDELFKEYFYEIRNCVRAHGFFEKFPSPSVLEDAQMMYRRLEVPTPADDDGNILPYPPKVTKDEVFASLTKSFNEIDNRVVNAPEELINHGHTVDVANYLCAGLEDDLSKIRAISTWLAIRQMQSIDGRKQKVESPDGWCRTFRSMCRVSRIKTKLVKGILRGPTYIPGEDLDKHRGCWISVLVNSTWWVVDPVIKRASLEDLPRTPLSSKIVDNQADQSLFRHAEMFFEDPEHFIFSHFPDEEYWQLLARPVSREELTDLAVLRQGFFALGMKVVNKTKAIIVANTEETTLTLGYPEHSLRQFMCKLYFCSGSTLEPEIVLNRNLKIQLRRFVYMETILNKHTVNIKLKFPRKGSYILDVYGFEENQPWQKICTYRLVYEHSKLSTPYPINCREEWGPGLEALKLGLSPKSHHGGELLIDKCVTQVVFKDRKGLQFTYEIVKDGVPLSSDLVKLSFLRDKDQEVVFIVDMEINVIGTFVLMLAARSDTSKPFQNFCNYIVKKIEVRKRSSIDDKKTLKPRLPFTPKENVDERAVLQAPENGQLQLTVDTQGVSQLVVDLKLHDKQELNFSEHTRHWIEADQGFVDLNFPRKGKYSVKILGRNVYDNRFKTLREAVVQAAVPSAKWSSFPKLESYWNSFYKIETPLEHHLEEKEDVLFTVAIRGAHDVAVLAPNGWYHLNQLEEGMWTGKVYSGPKSTRCKLVARFEIGSEKFSDLLWFKVMSEEDFDQMEERQDIMRENALKIVRDKVR